MKDSLKKVDDIRITFSDNTTRTSTVECASDRVEKELAIATQAGFLRAEIRLQGSSYKLKRFGNLWVPQALYLALENQREEEAEELSAIETA